LFLLYLLQVYSNNISIYLDYLNFYSNIIKQFEYEILNRWFDWIVEKHDCSLDLIFYLRTRPDTCLKRLQRRGRPEEINTVTLEYLTRIHELHETWLATNSTKLYRPPNVIIIDADKSIDEVYRNIEDQTKNVALMA
jgi:thymidylate kinase